MERKVKCCSEKRLTDTGFHCFSFYNLVTCSHIYLEYDGPINSLHVLYNFITEPQGHTTGSDIIAVYG